MLNKQTTNQGITLLEVYRRCTPAQCRVLEHLIQSGRKTNRQIARELYIEETTLEKHITAIGKIIGIRGRGKVKNWARKQKK